MIDSRAEIYDLLTTLGYDVEYFYPENVIGNNFPKISYYLSNSTEVDYREGKPEYSENEITVQVWEKKINGTMTEIFTQVDELLKANDYKRIYFDTVFDTETKIFNHTMRYLKIFKY